MSEQIEDVEVDDDLATAVPTVEKVAPVEEKEPAEWEKAISKLSETIAADRKPKEVEPQALTPEQQAEMWAIFDPKKDEADFMRKFFRMNPDATADEEAAAEKMFAKVQRGFVKQSVKSSMNFTEAALAKVREEFAPVVEYVQQAKAAAVRSRFNDAYPELADPNYEDILRLAGEAVGKQTFTSEEAYFKAVAETAARPIAKVNPAFKLGDGKKQTKSTGTSAKLPLTKVGGSGGTGGGKATTVSHGQDASGEIFDE